VGPPFTPRTAICRRPRPSLGAPSRSRPLAGRDTNSQHGSNSRRPSVISCRLGRPAPKSRTARIPGMTGISLAHSPLTGHDEGRAWIRCAGLNSVSRTKFRVGVFRCGADAAFRVAWKLQSGRFSGSGSVPSGGKAQGIRPRRIRQLEKLYGWSTFTAADRRACRVIGPQRLVKRRPAVDFWPEP